jgi:DNA repair/transcription protein MET18/MMS19
LLTVVVHALVPYLCARLENASAGLKDVAESLHTLSTWKRFPPGDAQAVATAVFKFGSSNNFASQTAVTRLALYELVDVLFKAHPATLKRDLSVQELVKGLVTMAELEKNPSCLRALFKLYAHISEKWELSAEEFKLMFDSFVRYFPVSMKDAPMDPSIPTTEELRELLLRCFVSNDGYATMTFEAMVDRLDVDSANTKVGSDSFGT